MKIVFDIEQLPLVYIAYPEPFSSDDWDEMIAQFDRLLDAQRPFGWINDARTAYLPNARNRSALGAHHKRRADDYRRWAKGAATVSQSTLVRGVITAIQWIAPTPFPHQTVATTLDGERYVRKMLGLPTTVLSIAPSRENQSAA